MPVDPRLASLSVSSTLTADACSAGKQTDRDSGDERDDDREDECHRIESDIDRARNEVGAGCDDDSQSDGREQQAERAAEYGHEHALRHELQHHVEPVRAERESRRNFLATRREPREQQVGDVRARDQQHAADRAEEHHVTPALLADRILEQRHHLDLRRRVHIGRVGLTIARRDDVHRFARLLERDARSKTRNRLEEEAAAIQLRRREKRHLGRSRHPDLNLIEGK